jgi:predicted Zn-dependent peptidase
VVKEEIRVNVLNRPYGGFPWLRLPPVLFDTFPNAHDGYGSFDDLESATVDDAQEFFTRYYAAGNAVLSVVGDVDAARAAELVERHFGDVPARPAPPRADFAEPDLAAERRTSYPDPLAPLPAFAAAWRVPDPIGDLAGYLPYVVLAEVLTDGDASRLVQRLVLTDRSVTTVGGYVGVMGDPFDVRDPTALLLQAHLPPGGDPGAVLAAVGEETDRVAQDGLAPGELERTVARMRAQLLRDNDTALNRALTYAVVEQQRGNAGFADDIPRLLTEVTADQVRAAAATLVPARRAVVEVVAGGAA